MESHIGWLGGSDYKHGPVDETLVSVDTYIGEVVRLTPEQLAIVKAHEIEEASSDELMKWLGVASPEEAEAFLADLENQV